MGAAQRRAYDQPTPVPSRPVLRLVERSRNPRATVSARTRSTLQAHLLFRAFCAVMIVVAAVGMLRITLAVQAAEAAIDSQRLERSIKTEALRTRALEADRSALEAPSRIAAIAGCTLQMTESGQVSYICLPDLAASGIEPPPAASATRGTAADRPSRDGIGAMVASVLDIAAGEAQVMLVGDVGLSSAR